MTKYHALLVEDNTIAQRIGARYLESAKFEVDLAETAEKAIELGQTHQYDLILMDISLPDDDGRNVTRTIRLTDINQQTPIIAITTHAKDSEEQSCLEAGITQVYAKPLTKQMLNKIFASFIEER